MHPSWIDDSGEDAARDLVLKNQEQCFKNLMAQATEVMLENHVWSSMNQLGEFKDMLLGLGDNDGTANAIGVPEAMEKLSGNPQMVRAMISWAVIGMTGGFIRAIETAQMEEEHADT